MPINLLPWREKHILKDNCQHFFSLFMFFLLVIPTVYSGEYYLSLLIHSQHQRNFQLSQQIEALSSLDIKIIEDSYQVLQRQVKLLQAIDSKQWTFWQEFALLQKSLPEPLLLTKISWDQQLFTLQGETTRSEQIGELIKILDQSHLFILVDLNNLSRAENESLNHFNIQAQHHLVEL